MLITHLNDGMGDPWAGQVMLKVVAFLSSTELVLSFEGNLGPADPIGSMKQ